VESRADIKRRTDIALVALASLGMLWFGGRFLAASFAALTYPFPIHWTEGGVLQTILRVLEGKHVYTIPTVDYVPFIYTPLYYYVAAAATRVTDALLPTARLISIASLLGTGALMALWLRGRGLHWACAIAGAGFFFASYPLSGRWYDIAKPDSFGMLLTMAGMLALHQWRGLRSAIAAGVLFAAAVYAKQPMAIAVAPVLLIALFYDFKRAFVAGAVLGVLGLSALALLEWSSGGWFLFYIFDLPQGHSQNITFYKRFWHGDLFYPLPMACVLTVAYAIYTLVRRRRADVEALVFIAALIGTAFASRLHSYGWINVLMPAHAALALAVPLAAMRLADMPWKNVWLMKGSQVVAMLIILTQFVQMQGFGWRPFPTLNDARRNTAFMKYVSKFDGEVLIPDYCFPGHEHPRVLCYECAGYDVVRARLPEDKQEGRKAFMDSIADGIAKKRFSALFISDRSLRFGGKGFRELDRHYDRLETLPYERIYRPYMDGVLRELHVYVPKKAP